MQVKIQSASPASFTCAFSLDRVSKGRGATPEQQSNYRAWLVCIAPSEGSGKKFLVKWMTEWEQWRWRTLHFFDCWKWGQKSNEVKCFRLCRTTCSSDCRRQNFPVSVVSAQMAATTRNFTFAIETVGPELFIENMSKVEVLMYWNSKVGYCVSFFRPEWEVLRWPSKEKFRRWYLV